MSEGDQANTDRISDLDGRVGDLESRLSALEQDLESFRDDFDITVERLETALRFSTPVHFAYDEAEVRSQDREILNRFASVIEQHYSDAMITIEGFTDPAGSDAYNMRLGKRRADAVKNYLMNNGGIPGERIRTVSYGENTDRLVRPGMQGPGLQGIENRRVVMVVDFLPRGGMERVSENEDSSGS